MARRKLTEADRLSQNIARAIRRSKCAPRDIVDALIAVAAGRAVVGWTHQDCGEFENQAHAAFHSAMALASARHKGDGLVN
jgi:hypothetical protein